MARPGRHRKTEEPAIMEIDGVPTAAGLIRMGSEYAAAEITRGGQKVTRITDKGHAIIGKALRARAEWALAMGEGDWTQPPSRTDLGIQREQ